MKLASEAFVRARDFMCGAARPLERKLFAHDFEGAGAAPAIAALAAFRNEDGGFGHGLEPDLAMPASSVLATTHALHILRHLGESPADALVCAAADWLLAAYDPELGSWRQISEEAEAHPHAGHWKWELHRDGDRWPVGILPRAEVLAHLHRSSERVPPDLLEEQRRRLVEDLGRADASIGPDAIVGCDLFVHTLEAPEAARNSVAARVREIGSEMASRDPGSWSGYSAKPLKLASAPDSVLADVLAPDVQRNLDWEIAHQCTDGSWAPNWSWNDAYPDAWQEAERAWRGHLTLGMLRSLRAYGRIEGE